MSCSCVCTHIHCLHMMQHRSRANPLDNKCKIILIVEVHVLQVPDAH